MSYGQVNKYTFAPSSGTYTPITGTTWQSGATVSTNLISGQIPLGFTFRYNFKNYTSIAISNNGYIVFGNDLPANGVTTPISQSSDSGTATNKMDGTVSGFGMDLVASTGTPSINYGASGGDFVVQFTDMARTGQTADRINFQIRLSSTTNLITIIYGTCSATTATTSPQVGLRGSSYWDWRNIVVTTAIPWSAPTNQASVGTATSTSTARFSSTATATVPASGQIFTYTPPAELPTPTYATLPATQNFDTTPWPNGNNTADLPSVTSWRSWPAYADRSWRRQDAAAAAAGWSAATSGTPTVAAPASGGIARWHTYSCTVGSTGYMDYYLNFTDAGEKRLTFSYINTDGTDALKVYLSTDGGVTFGTALATYGVAAAWANQALTLTTSTSATCVVRFEATGDWGTTDIGIDNVSVALNLTPPNCIASPTTPANGAASRANGNLAWTAPVGGASGYTLYLGSDGGGVTTPTNAINGTALGNVLTYTIANGLLSPSTTYYWQILPSNANGTSSGCSIWSFTTAPLPNCVSAPVPADAATNVIRNPTLSWTAPSAPNATSYDVYFGTSATPAFIGNQTTTTYTPGLLIANTQYFWQVVPKNIGGSSVGCVVYSFTTGTQLSYCTPTTTNGCTDGDVIARVILNTLDNNSGTGCPSGALGYSDYTTNPALTTTLQAGSSYNCVVYAGQYSEGYAAWIDYNDDGIFDNVTEKIGFSSGQVTGSGTAGVLGSSASFPINVACNPPVGQHRLRVRAMYNLNGSAVTPCTNNAYGEVEDYLITISAAVACPQPFALGANTVTATTANLTWTKGCAETSWEIAIQPVGSGVPVANGTPTTSDPYAATGDFSVPTEFYVRADCTGGSYSSWSGPFVFTAPSCTTQVSPTSGQTNVVPANGAVQLTWTAVPGATSYDVYFDTTAGTTLLGNIAATTVGITGTLYNTHYFWKIIAKNDFGSAVNCAVSDFTTTTIPAFDTCAGATSLDALTSPVSNSTSGLSDDFTPSCDISGLPSPDAFYSLTVPRGYTVVMGQTVNNYDSVHSAFYGTCGSQTAINCFDEPDTQTISWTNNTTSTQTFYWVQDGYAGGSGTFTLAWTLTPPAVTITSFTPTSVCGTGGGTPVTITGANYTGTTAVTFNGIAATSFVVNSYTSITAIVPAGNVAGPIVVTSAPSTNGSATSATNMVVNAYPVVGPITASDNKVCKNSTLQLSNASSGTWSSSDTNIATVSNTGLVTGVAGGNVTISLVVTQNGCSSTATYNVTVNESVIIYDQPVSEAVVTGNNAQFSVNAGNTTAYQWYISTDSGLNYSALSNDATFSGTNTSQLTVSATTDAMSGYKFYVLVSGNATCAALSSSVVTLTVGNTGITTQPNNVKLCNSGTAVFSVVATGSVLGYQWYENGSPITDGGDYSGATTSTLTISNRTVANNNTPYYVVVSGSANSPASTVVTLSVSSGIAISGQPADKSICVTGGSDSFAVTASGTVASYVWQYATSPTGPWTNVANGTPANVTYTGIATASLGVTTTAATPVAVYYYKAVLGGTDPCPNVESNVAALTINNPTIGTQPTAKTVQRGNATSFTVSANATSPTYQWQRATTLNGTYTNVNNGTPAGLTYSGATTAALTVTTAANAAVGSANFYRVMVTSGTCSVTSIGAQLTINDYCTPTYTTGKTAGDLISNIVIQGTTLSNNTGTAQTNPAYTFFSGAANLTASLQAGTVYSLAVTVGAFEDQNVAAWIDYNDDLVFDTTERIGYTSTPIGAAGTATFPIAISCNPPLGAHRMRIRDVYATTASAISPCSNYGYGETEDYIVTITTAAACPQPFNLTAGSITDTSVSLNWTIGCSETTWDVNVAPAGSGIPGTPSNPGITAKPFTKTGLLAGTSYEFYVRADCGGGSVSAWTGPFVFNTTGAPANDNFANAVAVTCGNTYFGDTTSATNDEPNPAVFGVSSDATNNVWYSFTGSGTPQSVTMSLCNSSFDTSILVATGTAGNLTYIAGNEDYCGLQSEVTFNSNGTSTYWIMVRGYDAFSSGAFSMSVSCAAACSPATVNDDCATAAAVTMGASFASNNACSTASPDDYPTCGSQFATYYDTWYTINSGDYTALQLSLTQVSPVSVGYAVYSGSCGALTQLYCSTTGGNINATGLSMNTTYYVRVFSTLTTARGSFSLLYNGTGCTTPTTWNGTAWSPFPPVATQPAIITGNYAEAVNLSACSLTITGTAQVTIPTGFDFNISGVVNVAATASLTVSNDANLVQSADYTGTTTNDIGSIKVNRDAKMWRQDYVYWGSPVTGQNLRNFSPATLDTRFYAMDETTNDFKAVFTAAGLNQAAATYNFVPGKGYMVRAPNTFPNPTAQGAAPTTTFNGMFTGVPNNGTVNAPVTNSGPGLGFNMLSNPYPSALSGTSFLTSNPGTLYFWTHHDQVSGNNVNYATFNLTGQTTAPAYAGSVTPDGSVAIGQGFVYLNANSQSQASFTNAMRTGNNTALFYRDANDKSRIWVNLAKGEFKLSQALVAYVPGTTTGFDAAYDGKLIEGGSTISSLIGADKYAIQARADFMPTDIVPMNFTATEAGNYSISIDHVDGVFEGNQDIFLHDLDLGITHDLKAAAYNFTAAAGTTASRFQLVYQASPLANPTFDANKVVIYKENNVFNINSGNSDMAKIQIFDIRGRLIYTKENINANTTRLNDLRTEQGVLLVQITSTDGIMVTRKVVY